MIHKPIGLDPSVDIISNDFTGISSGADYPTTLVESSFATLDADIAALAPGTTDPYDSYFAGASGRVVISYADVPEGDVIAFAEPAPEPATGFMLVVGCMAALAARRTRRPAA